MSASGVPVRAKGYLAFGGSLDRHLSTGIIPICIDIRLIIFVDQTINISEQQPAPLADSAPVWNPGWCFMSPLVILFISLPPRFDKEVNGGRP